MTQEHSRVQGLPLGALQGTGIVFQARLCSNTLPDRQGMAQGTGFGVVWFCFFFSPPVKLLKRRNPGRKFCFFRKRKTKREGSWRGGEEVKGTNSGFDLRTLYLRIAELGTSWDHRVVWVGKELGAHPIPALPPSQAAPNLSVPFPGLPQCRSSSIQRHSGQFQPPAQEYSQLQELLKPHGDSGAVPTSVLAASLWIFRIKAAKDEISLKGEGAGLDFPGFDPGAILDKPSQCAQLGAAPA